MGAALTCSKVCTAQPRPDLGQIHKPSTVNERIHWRLLCMTTVCCRLSRKKKPTAYVYSPHRTDNLSDVCPIPPVFPGATLRFRRLSDKPKVIEFHTTIEKISCHSLSARLQCYIKADTQDVLNDRIYDDDAKWHAQERLPVESGNPNVEPNKRPSTPDPCARRGQRKTRGGKVTAVTLEFG